MVEPFQEHLHARLADFFFVNAHRRERRVHQNSLITIVETDQADFVRHFDSLPPQKQPQTIGRLIVTSHDGGGARRRGKNSFGTFLAKIHETVSLSGKDRHRFEFVLAHGLAVTVKPATDPRIGKVPGKTYLTVALFDQISCGLERPAEIVETYLIVKMVSVHSNNIVTERDKRHLDGFDSAKQIRINSARQDDAVNKPMLLKNGR